jgi:photosynthetic reaction center H subunit
MTFHGHAKIRPLRSEPAFTIAKGDRDPRGMRVVGHDSVIAGTVSDVWVDTAEQMIRYLEVSIGEGSTARNVLVPFNFCLIKKPRDQQDVFYVHAISGGQFSHVPGTKKATEVTMLEEEKIMAYFGSGTLYSTAKRIGPKI